MMKVMEARAVLLPDEGELALSEDFFRSACHLRAERVTHTLVIDGGGGRALRLPLLVRLIEGTPYRDAISPYGFPGGVQHGLSEVPKEAVDWRGTELVSIFVRDRIGGPCCFAGGTARAEVNLIDSTRPIKFRKGHATEIRRNARLGYATTCRPVRESSREEQEAFKEAYGQTMLRNVATSRYFFSDAWFAEAFSSPAAWLVLTQAPDGHLASGAIAVLSDGCLHYYLGGTAETHLAKSPAKNDIQMMTELAAKLGVPLNLGGGVQPGDSLEQFKRGFANASSHFYTHEIICEPAVYARLSEGLTAGDYFPAYRAPRS